MLMLVSVYYLLWLKLVFSSPTSRQLNGSDMSNTSFWLRVALGSAVVAVLGFAIYRAAVRLKWPRAGWAFMFCFCFSKMMRPLSIMTKPPKPDPELLRFETFHFSPRRLPGNLSYLCPPLSDLLNLSYSQSTGRTWILVVVVFPSMLCPSFSALYCLSRPRRS